MMPSRSHEINGSRPSPLELGRESLSIGRKSTSSSNVMRQPVIIYAHSPKVIHTHAQDFRAVVQRLTGLSRSEEVDNGHEHKIGGNSKVDSGSSLVVTEEANGFSHNKTTPFRAEKSTNQQYLSNIPLFTPSSMVLFGSPNPVFRHTEAAVFLSPDRAGSVSPSVFKFMEEFP